MHYHRAEHWIVVRGTARVTRGDETYLLTENESTYIPPGTRHRLENPGKMPLEIIEVQSGAYLGEDDIVRFFLLKGARVTALARALTTNEGGGTSRLVASRCARPVRPSKSFTGSSSYSRTVCPNRPAKVSCAPRL